MKISGNIRKHLKKRLRQLMPEEIDIFASRQGVDRSAVEGFLTLITSNETVEDAFQRLEQMTKELKFDSKTVRAIRDGIVWASQNRTLTDVLSLLKKQKHLIEMDASLSDFNSQKK